MNHFIYEQMPLAREMWEDAQKNNLDWTMDDLEYHIAFMMEDIDWDAPISKYVD